MDNEKNNLNDLEWHQQFAYNISRKLPNANYPTSICYGTILGVLLAISEIVPETAQTFIIFCAMAWFIIAAPFLITGRDGFDHLLGKRSYWSVFTTCAIRVVLAFLSALFGVYIISLFE